MAYRPSSRGIHMKLLYNNDAVGATSNHKLLYTIVSDNYSHMYNVSAVDADIISAFSEKSYQPSPNTKHQLYSLPIIAENFNTIEELMHLIPEYFI